MELAFVLGMVFPMVSELLVVGLFPYGVEGNLKESLGIGAGGATAAADGPKVRAIFILIAKNKAHTSKARLRC